MGVVRGQWPYLECSSRGDRRFSALYARVRMFAGRSIEDIYQAAKVFPDGRTGLTVKEARGKTPINSEEVSRLYDHLWRIYMEENPHLYRPLLMASGLSDRFGSENANCQANSLWHLRAKYIQDIISDL